ncbi:MAG: peptidylprolyl isomerase [Phycisphaerales bacterium]|nr:peptidylprolyl isomerase [Phycisphaerales bacterium]
MKSLSTLQLFVAPLLCCALAPAALAQLTPDREYYGVGRTIPMTIALPTGVAGEVEVALYQPTGTETAKAAAAAGQVDLAGLFPVLWTTEDPTLFYAQLLVDGKGIGSPVVLSPMQTPNLAQRDSSGRAAFPVLPKKLVTYSGIRAWTDEHVVFSTSLGDMEFRMRPDQAPNTVANFLDLVEGGYYTDIIFHRIIGAKAGRPPFMAQVGDPTGTGSGGPGRFVDLEASKLPHDFGVLSMARTGDPNTNGGQVFVCFSREGTNFLDTQYCSFAEAVSGADVILALEKVKTDAEDRPADPPVLKSARLVPAPPFGTGPEALKRPADPGR